MRGVAAAVTATLLVCGGEAAWAQAECPPLLPRPDASYIVAGAREYVYSTPPDGPPLLLDAFSQPDGRVHPTVVVIHGGGWTSGSRVAYIGQLLELITEAGYQWVAVDYRLGGPALRHQAAADVQAALRFIGCHARALRIDPTRIAAIGEDVGAELALRAAAAGAVRAVALVGGTFDASLAMPGVPVRVVHGEADAESPLASARAYCDRVLASEGACQLDVVEDGIHRAENWRPAQWGYKARLVSWLRDVLGPGSSRPLTFPPQPLRGVVGPGLHKRLVYQPRTRQTLDAWIPAGAGPHVPVLLVHGGGWEAGDRVTYITPLFRPLAEAGLAWFSMDYRLTPEVAHAGQLQDLRDAIAFLRERAGSLNIDPARLVLVGESASGQMVAQIATEDAALSGVVSYYGVYDFVPFAQQLTPRSAVTRLFGITRLDDAARQTLERYSPLYHVHKAQPPMLLVHGTAEGLWAQGQAMAARLAAVGARHEMLRLDGAPHGMESWEGQQRWLHHKARVVEWIKALSRPAH